jgi:chromosome segregation ATPase
VKFKIEIKLPSAKELIAGLSVQQVYPGLERAQESAAKAEQSLDRARRELGELERRVAELPARIHRGEVKASALTDTMRERDAKALLIVPADAALTKAKEHLAAEEKYAKLALDREFARREEQLQEAAAEMNPALLELGELANALSIARKEFVLIDWECSPKCCVITRINGAMRTLSGGAE